MCGTATIARYVWLVTLILMCVSQVFMFTDLLIVTTQARASDKSLIFSFVDKLNFAKCDFADLGNSKSSHVTFLVPYSTLTTL